MRDDIIRLLEETKTSNDLEYKTKILNIVTTEIGQRCDECDGRIMKPKKVAVKKYYSVRPKEYYTNERYDEHKGETYERYVMTIPPRKFYTETEVYNYARYINRIAGRTLENDEMNLLLKTISRGRQYELTCLINRTEEFKNQTIWRENR